MRSEQNTENNIKKKRLKRLGLWLLPIILIPIIIVILFSGGGPTVYELSNMVSMSKQEIIDKYGSPDEIMYDEEEGYFYIYNDGFNIYGKDNGAYLISLSKDMVTNVNPGSYKMLDVYLDSSFDENAARLGTPDVNQVIDGKKTAIYLTQEDYLFTMSTDYNSDIINIMRLASYDDSYELHTLDLSQLLGEVITEEKLDKAYTIIDKSSSLGTILYVLDGFQMIVDSQEHRVQEISISQKSVYNILGVRTNDSLDKTNQKLGTPSGTSEGVSNTTRYEYQYEDGITSYDIALSIDNTSQKIGFIKVVSGNYVPEYNLERSASIDLTLDELFQPFQMNFDSSDEHLFVPGKRYFEIYDELEWTDKDLQVMESLFIECAFLGVGCFESLGNYEDDILKKEEIESSEENACLERACDYAMPIESKYWPYIEDMYTLFKFYAFYYREDFDPENIMIYYPVQEYYDPELGVSLYYPEHWGEIGFYTEVGVSELYGNRALGYIQLESEYMTLDNESFISQRLANMQFAYDPETIILPGGNEIHYNVNENEEELIGSYIFINHGIAVTLSLIIVDKNHKDYDVLKEEFIKMLDTIYIE